MPNTSKSKASDTGYEAAQERLIIVSPGDGQIDELKDSGDETKEEINVQGLGVYGRLARVGRRQLVPGIIGVGHLSWRRVSLASNSGH